MTIITKAIRAIKSTARKTAALVDAVIEAPSAALACVEMARESTVYARELSPEKRALSDMSMMAAANEKRLSELESALLSVKIAHSDTATLLTDSLDKLAESERKLAREVEARRRRQVTRGEGELPPINVPVLYQWNHPEAAVTPIGIGCMGQVGTYWWRYLSPEDMP